MSFEGSTESLKKLDKFTMITEIVLEKSNFKETTIFGFSNCGGWALVLD